MFLCKINVFSVMFLATWWVRCLAIVLMTLACLLALFFTLEYVDLICLVSFNTFFFFSTIYTCYDYPIRRQDICSMIIKKRELSTLNGTCVRSSLKFVCLKCALQSRAVVIHVMLSYWTLTYRISWLCI